MSVTCLEMGPLSYDRPSFEFKLAYTDSVIRKALLMFKQNCAVSWSGGKDSTFVLYRALKQNPNIKVIFENTLIEFPETIYFIRKQTKDWNLNLIETKPLNGWTFRKCLDLYGLPKPRQTQKLGKNREPLCCKYLKKKPALNAIESEGIECLLTGITTAESETRGYLKRYDNCGASYEGQAYSSFYYFTKEWNCWKFNPIMNWTEREIFDVHKSADIPLNEVYTKWNCCYKRCGCLPCTAYLGWKRKLSRSHPALYHWLLTFEKTKHTERFGST